MVANLARTAAGVGESTTWSFQDDDAVLLNGGGFVLDADGVELGPVSYWQFVESSLKIGTIGGVQDGAAENDDVHGGDALVELVGSVVEALNDAVGKDDGDAR